MKGYYEKTAAITGESFVFSSKLNFDMTCENRYFDGLSGPYLRYFYNPNDERVMKISHKGVTKYITDGNGQVLAEYDGDGNLKYNYIFGNGQKLARVNAAGTKEYLHNDYLGSVRRISDQNGDLIWSRDYYPFGETRQASGASEENLYTYEGKEKDLEIDLWYNTARFFNDEGRFAQVDPLWQKYPSISPYVRVADNPLIYTDPTGTVVVFEDEEQAKKAAEELNKLHNYETNITVISTEKTSADLIGTIKNIFSGNFSVATKTQTVYHLSTAGSNFDWGQNEIVSALYDNINSPDITFNVTLTTTYKGEPIQKFGGGKTDPFRGGADIYVDPSGYIRKGQPMGVVFLHEVIGHGHPLGEYDASIVNRYYGYLNTPHPGYRKVIGWKKTGLYQK